MFELLPYDALLMLRDGVEILQPDSDEALDLQGQLMTFITHEIESRKVHTSAGEIVSINLIDEPITGVPIGPPLNPNPPYCVDGHEFPNEDSELMGDGRYPPFVIFNTEDQINLRGAYPTREAAQAVADQLNASVSRD